MSEWQVGDLALCLKTIENLHTRIGLSDVVTKGCIYTVSGVNACEEDTGLAFKDKRNYSVMGWRQRYFKRIPPPSKELADEFKRELEQDKLIEAKLSIKEGQPIIEWSR